MGLVEAGNLRSPSGDTTDSKAGAALDLLVVDSGLKLKKSCGNGTVE